jgi:3-oxoacyl-[acyl-carrier-protein] synthase II
MGWGKDVFWNGLIKGRDFGGQVTYFDTTRHRYQKAAEVPGKVGANDGPHYSRMRRFTEFAAREAIEDSQLELPISCPQAGAVILGSLLPNVQIIDFLRNKRNSGNNNRGNSSLGLTVASSFAHELAREFGFCGPCMIICTACASSTNAIGHAASLIRQGRCEIALCGGADLLTEAIHAGFGVLHTLTNGPCRPFDHTREGFFLGEGAAILVLEEMEYAKSRGASIYGFIAGYGLSNDAYHLSAPHPEGEGAAKAISAALVDAGIRADDVGYINAHGTGTTLNDAAETKAIKKVFGEHARLIPVSSNKSAFGHAQGATGAFEAVATILSLYHSHIPPTVNFEHPDPACDLDIVSRPRNARLGFALSNSFAFGGANAVLVFKAVFRRETSDDGIRFGNRRRLT